MRLAALCFPANLMYRASKHNIHCTRDEKYTKERSTEKEKTLKSINFVTQTRRETNTLNFYHLHLSPLLSNSPLLLLFKRGNNFNAFPQSIANLSSSLNVLPYSSKFLVKKSIVSLGAYGKSLRNSTCPFFANFNRNGSTSSLELSATSK